MNKQMIWCLVGILTVSSLAIIIGEFIDGWRYWVVGALILLYGVCWGEM